VLLSIPLDRTLAKKKFSWEFAVHIDDNDPLWHKAIDGKEANIEGGVKEISDHYRNFCSRYSPWGCAQDSSEKGGHARAKKWEDDLWQTMDKYCVGKPYGGLKELHQLCVRSTGIMHPVMIQFTYVPKVKPMILKLPKIYPVILNLAHRQTSPCRGHRGIFP
jgi:hypothetical protein